MEPERELKELITDLKELQGLVKHIRNADLEHINPNRMIAAVNVEIIYVLGRIESVKKELPQ